MNTRTFPEAINTERDCKGKIWKHIFEAVQVSPEQWKKRYYRECPRYRCCWLIWARLLQLFSLYGVGHTRREESGAGDELISNQLTRWLVCVVYTRLESSWKLKNFWMQRRYKIMNTVSDRIRSRLLFPPIFETIVFGISTLQKR